MFLLKKYSENINKMQTAFPRSEIFPRTGMHKCSLSSMLEISLI